MIQPPMEIIEKSLLTEADKSQLMALWNEEYPLSLAHDHPDSFETYLGGLSHLRHFLLMEQNNLLAWAYSFSRQNERFFAIILSKTVQGKGWGRKLIEKLKSGEKSLNGWVIDRSDYLKSDGTFYSVPLPFYIKCGFRVVPEVRLETPQMSALKICWEG